MCVVNTILSKICSKEVNGFVRHGTYIKEQYIFMKQRVNLCSYLKYSKNGIRLKILRYVVNISSVFHFKNSVYTARFTSGRNTDSKMQSTVHFRSYKVFYDLICSKN